MKKFMVDSNVIIEYMKNNPEAIDIINFIKNNPSNEYYLTYEVKRRQNTQTDNSCNEIFE